MLIVLAGSTCVGKSSAGKVLTESLVRSGEKVRYLNETGIHSKDLRMMFREPREHAFYVQCEFLIRRTTTLLWECRRRQTAIMERFITDDSLFEEYWKAKGCISPSEHKVYQSLWKKCRARVPEPDIVIYFRCNPAVAERRLREREAARGDTMREVPSEFVEQYVYELTDWYERFVSTKRIVPTAIIDSDQLSIEEVRRTIQSVVEDARKRDSESAS